MSNQRAKRMRTEEKMPEAVEEELRGLIQVVTGKECEDLPKGIEDAWRIFTSLSDYAYSDYLYSYYCTEFVNDVWSFYELRKGGEDAWVHLGSTWKDHVDDFLTRVEKREWVEKIIDCIVPLYNLCREYMR